MSPTRIRRTLAVPAAVGLSILLAGQAMAAVSWSSATNASPRYTWNEGFGLARTVSGTTSYLHLQYSRASDPPLVMYRRGNAAGSSWTTPTRLSRNNLESYYGTIAADGAGVHVAWLSVVPGQDPLNPDWIVYARSNSNHGASTAWSGMNEVSGPGGVAGIPMVAASGNRTYVAYTTRQGGNVMLATSLDGGATWVNQGIGPTTNAEVEWGYEGFPVVAAAGTNVAVAWIADGGGKLVAALSDNGGATWTAPTTLAASGAGLVHAHALGDRIAFVWDTPTRIRLKVWKAGAWESTRNVASFSATGTFKAGYAAAVSLVGTARVGVAWSACRRADCSARRGVGVDIRWRESANSGSTWSSAVTLANSTSSSSSRYNDFPSIAWGGARKRFVLYNVASQDSSEFRLKLRVGSGSP